MFDLSNAISREALADKIKADIDEYCRVTYDDGPRRHLGASLLAHPCAMYLWATYRWLHEEQFDGRMQRLFNRGHREEARWVEWLRGTGWTVNEFQPMELFYHPESDALYYEVEGHEPGDPLVENVTGVERFEALALLRKLEKKQIRIAFAEGHGGGSLDCEISHPELTGGEVLLGEFKTYNEKQFAKLIDKKKGGVQLAKPQHWGQMSAYGYRRKIRHGVYFAICKNDDSIHIETHLLNWALGEELLRKGEHIILSKLPPPRLSENPQWRDCLWCGKYSVCHGGEKVDVNCRSCKHAEPRVNGEWFCTFHDQTIPPDFIPKACNSHFPLLG